MSQAASQVTTTPTRRRNRTTTAKAPETIDLFFGEKHWLACCIPAADQIIVIANRDRAELSRMVAAWLSR
jgi:hypothetical protein